MPAPKQLTESSHFLGKLRRAIEYCLDSSNKLSSEEAYWYAVWQLVLEYLFFDSKRTMVSPQWWLLRIKIPSNEDSKKEREARVPDFVVTHSKAEEDNQHKFGWFVDEQQGQIGCKQGRLSS